MSSLIDFPNSPAVNDTYVYSGITYQWDGKFWKIISGGGAFEPANANIQSNIGTVGTPHVSAAEKTAWNAKGSSNLVLGTTSATAYRGDYGNTAYLHSQAAHAPSNAQKNSDITKAEIEAKLTGTIASHTHNYEAPLNTDQKRKITISTSAPSGGADGDVWLQHD